jgi:CheY-like chemotaxis protein
MIVDDDPDLCHALGLRLRANHYKTLSTGDGCSALALAQKEHPDLVLLDLGLPGLATGAVVLKHMRTFPSVARIPVIVLTGWDLRDYEQPMLELGAARLLPEASRQRRTVRPYSCFATAHSLKADPEPLQAPQHGKCESKHTVDRLCESAYD